MRIYFSGSGGSVNVPESLIPDRKPHVMLTFYTIQASETRERLKVYLRGRKKKSNESKS